MRKEQLNISQEQSIKISQMLQNAGISQSVIDKIIQGEYESYDTPSDLEASFGGLKKYVDILDQLLEGYTMEELQEQGISAQKIDEFKNMLNQKNITVDNAQAIYQYSIESNMILGIKRGTSKETVQEQIMQDLAKCLQIRGVSVNDIEEMKQFVKRINYENTLYHNDDIADDFMEHRGLQQKARVSVKTAILLMHRCKHIDETIYALEEGLGKIPISKPMKLYRAVKGSSLKRRLKDGEDLHSLVGKSISNKSQISTSLLYDSSFALINGYDTIFEIYVPQGSKGAYIAELSAYDNEQEVLLNPNDLYIMDVQTGVVDKNGKTKNVLQVLCLSKDRNGYREIEEQKDEKTVNQETLQPISSTDLPSKQNMLSRFFNKIRSKFANKNQDKQPVTSKKKKLWELEPNEKFSIQKESAKIAEKHINSIKDSHEEIEDELKV